MNNDFDQIIEMKKMVNQELQKGRILAWNELHQMMLHKELNKAIMNQIQLWYQAIINISLLENIPAGAEEIFIHHANSCYIKFNDKTVPFHHDLTQVDIDILINYIILKEDQNWNYNSPYVSFNLKLKDNTFRATFIHHSLNPEQQTKVFFRVLNQEPYPLEDNNDYQFLKTTMQQKKNILIAGATGSGKTTLINSLLTATQQDEHIVVLEDTFELCSPNSRTTRLLTTSKTSMDQMLTYALRMSPDRIILGEMRSHEVKTFIMGMNTGHKGMISTIHANSATDALHRLALLYCTYADSKLNYELILKLICSNIDYVIFLDNKKITEKIEVYGSELMNIFYDNVSSCSE